MTLEDIRRVVANEEPYYPSYPGSDNPYRDGYYTEVGNQSNLHWISLASPHPNKIITFSHCISLQENLAHPTFFIKVSFVIGLLKTIQIHRWTK